MEKEKQPLERKEYAMQLLVGCDFSSSEFHMYYPFTNNETYTTVYV